MAKSSKRYRGNAEKCDPEKRYELNEALGILKGLQAAKFQESVDVAIRLGVDAKKSDQMVRGVAKMPHGTGKTSVVLVFAKGDKVQEAKDAGADFVGGEELVQQIKDGWLGFDKTIATPDMMPKVGQIARILGPRGLMPNPKVGTVTQDVAKAVREEKEGRVEFRVEKAGILHVSIGRVSFDVQQLAENFAVLMEQVLKLKPQTAKGIYIQNVAISSTMGPGFKLDLSSVVASGAKG